MVIRPDFCKPNTKKTKPCLWLSWLMLVQLPVMCRKVGPQKAKEWIDEILLGCHCPCLAQKELKLNP